MATHSEARDARSAPGGSYDSTPGASDERLLSALLDGMDAALFAVDGRGRITHWNHEAERVLGWSRAEAVGREGLGGWAVRDEDAADVWARLLSVTHEPDAGEPRAGESGRNRPERQVQEFPLRCRDGRRILVRAQTTPVWDARGGPAGVYCAFAEVHTRLALERELALSQALLSDASWAVLIVDADLRAVVVNDQAAQALAVAPADMLGEPLAGFFGGGLDELESALEHTLAGQPPEGPIELWVTLHDDGSEEAGFGQTRGGLAGGRRRCWLSGFLRLGSPLATGPAPLGVAWVFQDVTRARQGARHSAQQRFRDGQLSRAARAVAECASPLEGAVLQLEFALAGFAEHALLDVVRAGPGSEDPRLVRVAETPGTAGEAGATHGVPVSYRPGHPALQAWERGVPVRATGGLARADWATHHKWPAGVEHALCVVLRSRARGHGVVTFLRGPGRPPFDRSDAAYAEDVALRIAAAVDLAAAVG